MELLQERLNLIDAQANETDAATVAARELQVTFTGDQIKRAYVTQYLGSTVNASGEELNVIFLAAWRINHRSTAEEPNNE